MNCCALPATVTAAAYAIAENFNEDELALLATLFVQLGDTIASILACKDLQEKCRQKICGTEDKTGTATNTESDILLTPAILEWERL